MWSNGTSFNGSSAYSSERGTGIADRSLEPWFTSGLLRWNQDRGDI